MAIRLPAFCHFRSHQLQAILIYSLKRYRARLGNAFLMFTVADIGGGALLASNHYWKTAITDTALKLIAIKKLRLSECEAPQEFN